MNDAALHSELLSALSFYADCGVDCIVEDEAIDRTAVEDLPSVMHAAPMMRDSAVQNNIQAPAAGMAPDQPAFLGKSDAYDEAVKCAAAANTIDELRAAVLAFDGISIKKTASNLVFADGCTDADIMVIGDAPGADEDRVGKPFVGASGQLLDRILACIDLDRQAEEQGKQVYISNILNWRPPGNRTPSPAEIEVSLPFIERHIQLAQPKLLIFCGGVAAKALLDRREGMSRLRKTWHAYKPLTEGVGNAEIPAIATYHPSDLLQTPIHKRSVWEDILSVAKKRQDICKNT